MNALDSVRERFGQDNRFRLLAIAGAVLIILILLFFLMPRELVIKVNGAENTTVEYGTEYSDQGADAFYRMKVFHFIGSKKEVETSGKVNTKKLGDQTIEYKASFDGQDAAATRTVTVQDTTKPGITLLSDENYFPLPGHEYEEEGFEATDLCDGVLTDKVKRTVKDDRVIYTVSDKSGNTATVERGIIFDDRNPPVITFDNVDPLVYEGDEWTDSFVCEDEGDGDLTDKVEVTGEVDTSKVGEYTLTYKVKDSYDNEAVIERVITVLPESERVEETDKTIYLTFDDGPGQYTERLLNMLDQYGIKVTFFVTNQYSDYQNLIAREAEAGHSIAVHSYSHDYKTIYSSDEAFWADFDKMNDIIEQQTGKRTKLMRFPGGSSNTVSRKYSQGIMSRLTEQATEKGLVYFDWNISSGDGGDTTSSAQVLANVQNGVQKNSVSVILCHDIKEFTINAMETFIPWALENGYHFRPLKEASLTAHQNVNN